MFDIGIQELIVIFTVALLVFGPKRLPELGKSLGKGLAELKKAIEDVKEQMNTELKEVQKTDKGDSSTHLSDSQGVKTEDETKGEPQTVHEKERKEGPAK